MIAPAGAGPKPILQQQLPFETLSEAIAYCASPEASRAAEEVAGRIQSETGVEAATKSFHKNIPTIKYMAGDIIPHLPAAFMFEVGKRRVRMSSLAAVLEERLLVIFAQKALKGMTVDIPVAISDGLKNVPRVYGDTPRDNGPAKGLGKGMGEFCDEVCGWNV